MERMNTFIVSVRGICIPDTLFPSAYILIGRTARIGNEGLATSFYNDNDEGMAQFIVNTLIECRQPVPDFLTQYKPANENEIEWNDDSGAEDDDGDAAGAGADAVWGSGDGNGDVTGQVAGATTEAAGIAGTADNAWGSGNNNNTFATEAW